MEIEATKTKKKKKSSKTKSDTSKSDDTSKSQDIVTDIEEASASLISDVVEKQNQFTLNESLATDNENEIVSKGIEGDKETLQTNDCNVCEVENKQDRPLVPECTEMESNASTKVEGNVNFQEILQTNQRILSSLKLEETATTSTKFKINEVQIRPYTEAQLRGLYANIELENVPTFLQEFIEVELKTFAVKKHTLFELLENYLQARNKLVGCALEINQNRQEYKQLQNHLWSLEVVVTNGQGLCHDRVLVKTSYSCNKATFHRSTFQSIGRILNTIRQLITEKHILYSFSAEVLKLQIELYLTTLKDKCMKFTGIGKSSPVLLRLENYPNHVNKVVDELRLSISVLFAFQRRLVKDKQFIKETRSWLGNLVAVLLRAASWQDHLFVLNHVLRCPPGVSSWASNFIQVPSVHNEESPFTSPYINHLISILMVILTPIPSRELFLSQFVQVHEGSEELRWVIIDSEGDDDEESDGTSLKENDLVQLLNQLPFGDLFRSIMLVERRDNTDLFTPARISEMHILRFMAFCSVLLKILDNGLDTYSRPRYNQFSKRLCRFIRHIIEFMTDQWEAVLLTNSLTDLGMRERLQVEYDAFFLRATNCLYRWKKLGSWQYLTVIPYHMVTINTLWQLFYLLHESDAPKDFYLNESTFIDFNREIWKESFRSRFEENIIYLDEADSYYLLNSFANMALSRNENESTFISATIWDLLQVGFIAEATRESCSKNSRILLAHITSKFPQLQSNILKAVKSNIITIDALALYLFEELPLSIWKITDADLDIIATWLTHTNINSSENRLARMILSRLNWGFGDNNELFLPHHIHLKVALLVAQSVDIEPGYLSWAWQTVFRLRLHINDREQNGSLKQIPELENLDILHRGVREEKPLHCFLALMISSWGHLVPLICANGLQLLEVLYFNQRYDAILFSLQLIVPLFLECQESLINSEKFQTILVNLLHADRSYMAMAKNLITAKSVVLEQFANMLTFQVSNFKYYNLNSPRYMIRLWMNSLVSVPNWNQDHGVLYLMDTLIRITFFYSEVMDEVASIMRDLLQSVTPQEKSSSIASLFKWSTESTTGNLLSSSSLPNYAWIAYIFLNVEYEEKEKNTGLWKEILVQLKNHKKKINIDATIKNAAMKLKVPPFSSAYLCFYRFAQQALDTPLEHPMLPLLWQKFFSLYLMKVTEGGITEEFCVGAKFFDGIINFNFFKKLKKRLQESVDFYQKMCIEHDEKSRKQCLHYCLQLFKAYSLWLEEPRLQEPNLYLANLPSQYEPQLLSLIFYGDLTPWIQFLDYDAVKEEESKGLKSWRTSIYREKTRVNQPLPKIESCDPVERTIKRLQSFDNPNLPPLITETAPIISPIVINNREEMYAAIKPHMDTIMNFSKTYLVQIAEYKAMDSLYRNLAPELYKSFPVKIKKQIYCNGVDDLACTGAAIINFDLQEARLNEGIDHQIQRNRTDYDGLLDKAMQTPAKSLCVSSLVIQKIIENLKEQTEVNASVAELGIELFYKILSLINKDTDVYPPAKYFLHLCVEKLGQFFISGNEYETPRLLNKMLEEQHLVPMLVPHFSPNCTGSKSFTAMYSLVCESLKDKRTTAVLPLLTKFELSKWLISRTPPIWEINQYIDIIMSALQHMGLEPSLEMEAAHTVLRKDLLSVFEYEFPQHYRDVILHLLKDSHGDKVFPSSVWMDVLNFLAKPVTLNPKQLVKESLRAYSEQQKLLCYHELFETTVFLRKHFSEERLRHASYGLYPMYKNYIHMLTTFMGMIAHAIIIAGLNTHPGLIGEKLCEKIWPPILEMFLPWTVPFWCQTEPDRSVVLLPWVPADEAAARNMVDVMVKSIEFINDTLPACNILSCVWQSYEANYAYPAVKEHILNVIHDSWATLPWHQFWPMLGDLELMLKVVEQCLPQCHSFTGYIFIQIQWPSWITHIANNASSQVIARIHECLLHLFVKLCNEPQIRSSHGEKARTLLLQAEYFKWEQLDPIVFKQVTDWLVMSCDPSVLLKSDPLDLDFRILNLLKVVAYYDKPLEVKNHSILQRRHIFIRTYVKLFSVYASTSKKIIPLKQNELSTAIAYELKHIEAIVTDEEEMKIILEEFFGLCSINELNDIAAQCIAKWVSDKSSESMVLRVAIQCIGSSIANNHTIALLYETAINAYFSNAISHDAIIPTWTNLYNLVKDISFSKPELEKIVISKGQLLFLFLLLLKKVANSCDNLRLLNTILQWLDEVKLCPETEDILPLFWSKFLEIALEHSAIDQTSVSFALHKLAISLLEVSDKGTSGWGKGLLGAIGIVKQDALSIKFKFLCRATSGYILAQLPEAKGGPQVIRIDANAPCSVGQPGGNSECPKVLLKLDFNQSQGEIKNCAEFVLKQIQDPKNSLHNVRECLAKLVERLFTKSYLKDIDQI